jgi:hypothetical protein
MNFEDNPAKGWNAMLNYIVNNRKDKVFNQTVKNFKGKKEIFDQVKKD